jgi:hypothetical protein
LGALGALPIGSLLSKVNTVATVCGVAVAFFATEGLVVYLILRKTPRITVDRGKMTIGHLLNGEGRSISVQAISSIELMRGSMAVLALSEGGKGEGRVLVHLVQGSTIELGWDAFAGQANTLAWILGVSLYDAAADAPRGRAATLRNQDPGREKRQRILVTVGVVAVVLVVVSLLFAPS